MPEAEPMSPAALQRFMEESFAGSPVPYRVEEADLRGVAVRLLLGGALIRPGGWIAGPSLMALADTAAWLATLASVGPVAGVMTAGLHVDFLRPAPATDLCAVGALVKLGRRLSVVDVSIAPAGAVGRDTALPGTNVMVAKASVTCSLPPSLGDEPGADRPTTPAGPPG